MGAPVSEPGVEKGPLPDFLATNCFSMSYVYILELICPLGIATGWWGFWLSAIWAPEAHGRQGSRGYP